MTHTHEYRHKHTRVNIYTCVYIRMIFMMYIQPLLRSYFGIVQWWEEVKIYARSIFICVCGCTTRYTCLSITWIELNVLLMVYIVCPEILWTAKILNTVSRSFLENVPFYHWSEKQYINLWNSVSCTQLIYIRTNIFIGYRACHLLSLCDMKKAHLSFCFWYACCNFCCHDIYARF